MRKTNFILGFRPDDNNNNQSKQFSQVPRQITVISEEIEPPSSVMKKGYKGISVSKIKDIKGIANSKLNNNNKRKISNVYFGN